MEFDLCCVAEYFSTAPPPGLGSRVWGESERITTSMSSGGAPNPEVESPLRGKRLQPCFFFGRWSVREEDGCRHFVPSGLEPEDEAEMEEYAARAQSHVEEAVRSAALGQVAQAQLEQGAHRHGSAPRSQNPPALSSWNSYRPSSGGRWRCWRRCSRATPRRSIVNPMRQNPQTKPGDRKSFGRLKFPHM